MASMENRPVLPLVMALAMVTLMAACGRRELTRSEAQAKLMELFDPKNDIFPVEFTCGGHFFHRRMSGDYSGVPEFANFEFKRMYNDVGFVVTGIRAISDSERLVEFARALKPDKINKSAVGDCLLAIKALQSRIGEDVSQISSSPESLYEMYLSDPLKNINNSGTEDKKAILEQMKDGHTVLTDKKEIHFILYDDGWRLK